MDGLMEDLALNLQGLTPTPDDVVKGLLLVHNCHSVCLASSLLFPGSAVHVFLGKAAFCDSQLLQAWVSGVGGLCYQLWGWALPPPSQSACSLPWAPDQVREGHVTREDHLPALVSRKLQDVSLEPPWLVCFHRVSS